MERAKSDGQDRWHRYHRRAFRVTDTRPATLTTASLRAEYAIPLVHRRRTRIFGRQMNHQADIQELRKQPFPFISPVLAFFDEVSLGLTSACLDPANTPARTERKSAVETQAQVRRSIRHDSVRQAPVPTDLVRVRQNSPEEYPRAGSKNPRPSFLRSLKYRKTDLLAGNRFRVRRGRQYRPASIPGESI